MAYDIGTARGVIEMEYNGRGVSQAQDDLGGLGAHGSKAQGALNDVGNTAGKAGLAVAAGLALAVRSAANFEERISAIGAVSGASSKQLDTMRSKAMQLGADTSFSASEAASAMEELVKAGLSVDEVLNGAADATVALAAAGEVDLPQAAMISSNAMNQFNLKAEDMVGVVDSIAGAANASAIDVGDFGQSLGQVGAVANLAGVNFEDTATAIAIMGNAGIKGSDAGTSLKSMLMRLQPATKAAYDEMTRLGLVTFDAQKGMEVLRANGVKPLGSDAGTVRGQLAQLTASMSGSEVGSAKQAAAFQKLGLQTGALRNQFYTAKGETKDLSALSGTLGKSLEGMTKQQKQAALTTLFGSDAIRAAAILANNGSKGFDKMAASIGKVSAADVAAKRLDNFNGKMEAFKGSLETAGIVVGSALLPALTQLVGALTGAFNWFTSLSSGMQNFITGGLASTAALLLIVAGVAKMIVFAAKLSQALSILRVALAGTWIAALGPIGLIIIAVMLVVAAIVILWKKSETFRSIVIGVWNAIKSAAMAVANWFTGSFLPAIQSVWDSFKTGLSQIGAFFSAVWSGIVTVVKVYIMIIATIIKTYIAIWVAIITTGLSILKAIWGALWGTFGGIITGVFNLIVAIIKLAWTIIKGVFLLNLMLIKAVVMSVFNGIKAVIQGAMAVIRAVVSAGVNAARAVFTAVWNAIRASNAAVWGAISGAIKAVWGVIGGTVMSGVNRVKSAVSGAWNTVKNLTTSAWHAFSEIISNAINTAMALISGIQGRITGALSGAAGWLYDKGKEIIQGLINGIEDMIGNVTSAVSKVTDAVGKFLPGSPVKEGALKKLNRGHAGKQIVQMVIDGIDGMATPLARAMDGMMTAPQPAMMAAPRGVAPMAPRRNASGDRRRERIIDGELRLHKSGRAFITGLAMDANDDNGDFNDLIGRMR